jgi:hypothetical protein
MARASSRRADLARVLDEALDLLTDYQPHPAGPAIAADPLPSLLMQCEALCADADSAALRPVRTLHHLACTGGTLIARAVAALPNVVLLNEIYPLSRLHLTRAGMQFHPTDILIDLHHGLRAVEDEIITDVFVSSVARLRENLGRQGRHLVIRDHAHSLFCTTADPARQPTLRQMIARDMPVTSVVTLRHPLDSFLALDAQGWRHFTPFTLDEYCRRYLAFLVAHRDVAIVRYEDLVADPVRGLSDIAGHLDLPQDHAALDLIELVHLSGDSGRKGDAIRVRSRRPVPAEIAADARQSEAYATLCARHGYDADPA